MRTFLFWRIRQKEGALMDATSVVDSVNDVSGSIPREIVAHNLMKLLKADEVIYADSEEEVLSQFTKIKKVTKGVM